MCPEREEKMESRREQAVRYFREGYNCTQAVVLAHADLFDMDREVLLSMCQSFGGGMARMRQVCGAVSGMFLVAGVLTGSADPKDRESKKRNYETVQKLAALFEEKNGSIICAQLLGLQEKESCVSEEYRSGAVPEPRTEQYYKKRPCPELIGDACDVLAICFPEENVGQPPKKIKNTEMREKREEE